MSQVDKTPEYFCTVDKQYEYKILGVMREFIFNAIGYATIVAFIFSVIYTWGETTKMLKEIEKQNNAL